MSRNNGRSRAWQVWFVGAICLGLVLSADRTDAGQEAAASIIGRVIDEGGGVLPGVTVSATSPALQVAGVTAVTDDRGEYRLTPLPVGIYAIEYALSGFQTIRQEGIRLTVGFTAKLDVTLKVGGIEETLTVTGQSPLVDVRSTTTSTQFTREQLEILPTSRNSILSLMAQAPGVRSTLEVGGNVTFSPPGTRVFGQGAEPWYVLEGVVTTSLQTSGGFGQYWDYGAIEEAAVQTLGTNAEVGSRGVFINAIVKSGGNNFSGSLFGGRMSDRLQSDNIDEALAAQGIRAGGRLVRRFDVSGDLGGRIVRDKLWFYGAARYRENIAEVLNAVKTDGSQATADQGQRFFTGKLSYQMNSSNRLVGFYQYSLRKPSSSGSVNADWVSRSTSYLYQRTQKVEWQTLRGSSLVATVQWGHWDYWDPRRFCIGAEELGRDCPGSAFDRFLDYSTGAPTNEGETLRYWRHHPKATVGWYKPNLLGGNHDFKAAVEYLPSRGYRGNYSVKSGQNYRLVFNNGQPIELEAWNYPTMPNQHVNYFGVYGQDAWTIGRRLTLNLGLRYGHDNSFIPASCRAAADAPSDAVFPATCFERVQFNVQNMWSPRLRAAYDLTGDGRTVIKGGWGRYNQMHYIDPDVQNTDPQEKATATFRWNDLNQNRRYDSGEVNWDPNGSDFIRRAGGSNQVTNPNERTPKNDEISLTIERQVRGTMAARVTGLYTRTSDVYRLENLRRPYEVWTTAVTRPDPGDDGLVGSADDPGTQVTFYAYPAALRGAAFELFTLVNDPDATQTYQSIELALARRLVNRWQFSASYSATRTNTPIVDGLNPGEFALTNRAGSNDPNAEIFAANRTWEWLGRVSGAYLFPADIAVSANFEHRSGIPWARQVLFTGVPVLSSITLRTEPIGTRRLPNINTLDVRFEKAFRIGTGKRLQMRLNMYNALNANTVTATTFRAGPMFMRPTSILPPRNVEYSLSYTF
jgi:hypothetical protein